MKQLLFIAILLGSITASAQEEVMHLTLPQAIEMAQAHSPEAEAALHTYRAAYWNHRISTNKSAR